MTLSRDVIWHMARDSAQLPRLGTTRVCARLAHDTIILFKIFIFKLLYLIKLKNINIKTFVKVFFSY